MFRKPSKTTDLRAQWGKALNAERLNEALELYELIEKRAPDEARWSHRRGDLLQRVGRKADAVLAYERAVDLYAAKGFVARAAAMAKLIIAMDPTKGDVLDRVDPEAARRLHRKNRAVIVTADEAPTADYEAPPTDTQSLITDALPLIADRKAPRGETRFTKPEKTEDVTLDLTDVELLEPEKSGIHVASYWKEALPKAALEQKLRDAVRLARAVCANDYRPILMFDLLYIVGFILIVGFFAIRRLKTRLVS